MAEKPEAGAESVSPDMNVHVDRKEALKALEYAISTLGDSAAFAREMAERARTNEDPESAGEFDNEAAEIDRHRGTLSRIAGSLRVLEQLQNPRGSRAA